MKNSSLIEFLNYFKDNMKAKNINYIEHIISTDDRLESSVLRLADLFETASGSIEEAKSLDIVDPSDRRQLNRIAKTDKKAAATVSKILNTDSNIKSVKKAIPNIDESDTLMLKRVLAYYLSLQKGISPSVSIIFRNGDIWNLENTSSLRSDRNIGLEARLSQFRSERNYLIIDEFGKAGTKEKRPYTDPRNNVRVVSREEFVDDIMWQIFRYNNNKPWGKNGVLLEEKNLKSVVNSHRGNEWEKLLEATLLNEGFLKNIYEIVVKRIADDEGVAESDIKIIDAKQIPGKAKSDFWIEYEVKGVRKPKVGVSLKASGEDKVSVHQTKATDLISGLKISDPNVKKAINDFEKAGSGKTLTAKQVADLEKYFSNPTHYSNFISWAFTRGGGIPVKYILLHSYNSDETYSKCLMRMEKIDDYMAMIKSRIAPVKKSKKGEASFGTGISWTCPSGTKEIQFKTPFIFE